MLHNFNPPTHIYKDVATNISSIIVNIIINNNKKNKRKICNQSEIYMILKFKKKKKKKERNKNIKLIKL